MRYLLGLITGLALAMMASLAQAADFKPAVIYDMGGKFDKSFNEGVYNGIKRFEDETGVKVMEFEVTNETQREQAMQRMVQRGATVVLGVGFAQADAIDKVAKANPDRKFAIIDVNWLDQPNLRQYAFKEHEGSYLVGVAAAMASKTGKVGFVGGMDIPLIRKFACGYVQGVKSVSGDIEVLQNMTGTTPSAWNDPGKGSELTQGQIDRGADVIYHAAGGTGRRLSENLSSVALLRSVSCIPAFLILFGNRDKECRKRNARERSGDGDPPSRGRGRAG